jgi:hypothetical protein
MEPRHEQIAKIALVAGARYGLALAGGYAVSAHGMGNRPSGDVDLFTSWQHRYYLDVPFDESLRRHAGKPQASQYGAIEMKAWYRRA